MSEVRPSPSLDELVADPSKAGALNTDAVRSVLARCAAAAPQRRGIAVRYLFVYRLMAVATTSTIATASMVTFMSVNFHDQDHDVVAMAQRG